MQTTLQGPRGKGGRFIAKGSAPFIGSDPKFETKMEALKAGATKNGYNFSHYGGNYGPSDLGGAHVLEIDNAHVAKVTQAAQLHGIALVEHPQYSGSEFKVYVAHHGEEEPTMPSASEAHPLNMQDVTKIAEKKGSNKGGVYTDNVSGHNYYIKEPKTEDHVVNEVMAAKLYQLAGVRTMDYVPVEGGKHVATVMQKLDKDNIAQFTPAERTEAQKDFGVHAWLANHDAAGTGGDNQVIVNGKVATVDVGGSMKYRAQGAVKAEFGNKVIETQTMRGLDPNIHAPDAAALYGPMSDKQLIASYKVVTSLHDGDIVKTVMKNGGDMKLANQLIARKDDLLAQQQTLEKWSQPAAPLNTSQQAMPTSPPTYTLSSGKTVPLSQNAPEPIFATKMEHAKHLILQGTTAEALKTKFGWKAVSMPDVAHKNNLNLTKTKVGGVFHYQGTHMTAEEIANKGDKPAPTKAGKAGPKVAGQVVPGAYAAASAPKTVLGPNTNHNVQPAPKPIEAPKAAAQSHDFQSELTAKGIPHGYVTEPKDEDFYQLSAPVPSAAKMAEVAKNHPQWKLKPGAQSTYTAPKNAFGAGATQHDISTPLGNFKQSLDEHGVKYTQGTGNSAHDYIDIDFADVAKAKEVAKWHPAVTSLNNHESYSIAKNISALTPAEQASIIAHNTPKPTVAKEIDEAYKKAGLPNPTVPPVDKTPPTDAELAKAKKNVKLQVQYVPGAPQGHPDAQKLVDKFNEKYEGKTLSDTELHQKVTDFKLLTAAMVPLQTDIQKNAAAVAEKQKAAQAVQQKTQAQTKAEKLKKAAEEIENLHTLPDEDQRKYWLKQITGSSEGYVSAGASAIAKSPALQKAGISPAEVGFIKAFTGPSSHVNEEMRQGFMSDKVFAFKHIMVDALAKMPAHGGDTVYRKITIDPAEQAKYVPGQIVHWKAFNSTSKNPDTWSGNTHFTIMHPKTGVDVQSISSHPSEAEVIMPADSYYKVLSNTKSGSTSKIEMVEVLPFGKKKAPLT